MIDNLSLAEKAALLSGKNVWETRGLPRHGVPALFMADGPHGVRKQLGSGDHLGIAASEKATCFPTAATIANSWDPQLAERIGEALGEEAASLNVQVLLGPGLNIKRSPLMGRNFEYFSEDPLLTGKLAAGYVRGIQSRGVAATPKHFAVNSQELRRMSTDSVVDERTLREIYLTAFEIVVRESEPRALMSSYNLVNGVYANESVHLLTNILREEWGFDGAVITDWGGGNDTVDGVRHGCTVEMPSPGLDSIRQIVAAYENGTLSAEQLDARVEEALGLALASRSPLDPVAPIDIAAHHTLAQHAAEQSIVLLKNDGPLLPLAANTRVAVIGDFAATPRYQGAGSSMVNPTQLTTGVDALRETQLDIVSYTQGFDRHGADDEALAREALAAAKSADIVLFYLGLDEVAESEGLDREHMRLSENQTALLARVVDVNPAVVVILSAGAAVEMPWLESVPALLHGYLSGQAGAEAMARVITGAVNPSGRLAETYPLTLEDSSAAAYFPGRERTSEYREALYVGYRYHSTAGVPVRFPFGFGLSYTSFEYSDLRATTNGVSVTVRNSGPVGGAEVVQVYVGRRESAIPRPAYELKGFSKVYVEAGGEVRVSIPLDDKAFRYYDVPTRAWQVEGGQYEVSVGANVADLRLTVGVDVAGTITPEPDKRLPAYYSGQIRDVSDTEFEALLGRPIPPGAWSRGPLSRNDALAQMGEAKGWVARMAHSLLRSRLDKSLAASRPDLNLLFLYNMPFRAIAKMTNGAVSMEMVDDILLIVNGHFLRGTARLIRGYCRNLMANRTTSRDIATMV